MSLEFFSYERVRAFQLALQANRTMNELNLRDCDLEDAGIRLHSNALVGKYAHGKVVHSSKWNSFNGLDDIIRLIESTRLQAIDMNQSDQNTLFINVKSV
jgi:hypothetical protein